MAGNFNKVMLMGNLTRDIEVRYTPSNTAVANLGLAVNRRYRTQDGQQHEETTFVDCEAWGRTAEVMQQYLRKGSPVFLEGRLKLDQWQDKDGGNRSKLKVVVENFQFVDSASARGVGGDGGSGGAGGSGGGGVSYGGGGRRQGASAGPASGGGGRQGPPDHDYEPIAEDDIPF